MKKFLLFSMALTLLFSFPDAAAQKNNDFKFKGTVSPDSENEDTDPDPSFTRFASSRTFVPKSPASSGGNSQHVSDLENGLNIVRDIIDRIVALEYDFSLLPQHKYMVNSCLGLKVSAGEFRLKFADPVVELSGSGKFTVILKVNRISFSALKIRTKPCSKPQHVLDPCHFGGKFEIGGEATDLKMKAVIEPMASGVLGSGGLCYFAFPNNIDVRWTLGGINLRPVNNILDNVGKEMIEDALNGGTLNIFYNKFIELSREVIPQYFSACEGAYNVSNIAENVEEVTAIGSGANSSNSGTTANSKWEIRDASLKGMQGRLNSEFPGNVDWRIDIYTTENKFIRNHSKISRLKYYDLSPGNYNLKLNTVLVENVPIEKGKETRLKAGFLNIVSKTSWELRTESKNKYLTSGSKPQNLALPAGNYQLKLGTQFYPITIQDGKTIEY